VDPGDTPRRPPETAVSRRLIAPDRHTVRLLREHRRRQRAEQRAAAEATAKLVLAAAARNPDRRYRSN
jgi:hypothetical protein